MGEGAGSAMLVGAAVVYSTAGLFTRVIPLDPWTMLFWRGLFSGLFIAAFLLARHRWRTWGAVRRLGAPGLAVAVASTLGMICYIHALRLTTVADVAVIYAASPFVTATMMWLWLRERQRGSTLLASLAALVGVAIMIVGTAGDAPGGERLLGDALALAMTVCVALAMILIYSFPATPMMAAAGLSSFLTALAVWPLAAPWSVTAAQFGEVALFGVQLALGLLLLTLGSRLVPATRSALIGTLDAPLAPIWVLLAFAEIPSWRTVIGGSVVMAGVVAHILAQRGRPALAMP